MRGGRAAALALGALAPGCGEGGGGIGGGGGGGGGGGQPVDTSQILPTLGLVSVAAGDASAAASDGLVQARWDARDPSGVAVPVALFLATSSAALYQGAPVHTAAAPGAIVLPGLVEDQVYWLGLAAEQGGGRYRPVGSVMRATPGTVFYVDAASTAVNPTGATPATAFPTLIDAVLVASSLGGIGLAANVWVAGGSYLDVAVPLLPGVHLYGGFDPAFDLALRDPLQPASRSVLHAQPSKAVIEVRGGDPGSIVDGFEIAGTGATFGIDVDSSPARLSSLEIHDCTGRGLRVRSLSTTSNYRVGIIRCSVVRSGAEGLSLRGPFKLDVEDSRFSANGLEGLDLDDLLAPDGVSAALAVRHSTFFGNGGEGLDCDLGAPPLSGAGSTYSIVVDGSRFERNGWNSATPVAGMRLDIEFEGIAGWSADILVRGSTFRANRGHGLSLDLDSTATTLVHRVLSTANGGDGIHVSSESAPALALVSTSVCSGNLGAGVRVTGGVTGGNVPVVLTHSAAAGNAGGGIVSELVESAAVSSVAWLQPAPWSGAAGVRLRGVVVGADPLAPLFAVAPLTYRRITAFSGAELTLNDVSGLAQGDLVELADDAVLRSISGFAGANQVVLDVAPASLEVPASLARFPSGGGVLEDWSLAPGSAAQAAGMPPPSGPIPDAGLFGAPFGGRPGDEGATPPALFRVGRTTPPTTATVSPQDDLAVAFVGGTLDSLSIAGHVQVRDAAQQVVTIPAPILQNGELLVLAPAAGWPVGPLTLELFAGLATSDTPPIGLVAPVALPFVVQ